MKKTPILIAFTCNSILCCASETLPNCVSASTANTLPFDTGIRSIVISDDPSPRFYLSAGNHYLTKELSHFRLEGCYPSHRRAIGSCIEWFGYELYHHICLQNAMVQQIGKKIHLGIALNMKLTHHTGLKEGRMISTDLSLRYALDDRTDIYCQGTHLFGNVLRDSHLQEIKWRRGFTSGLFIRLTERVKCAIEGSFQKEASQAKFGIAYGINSFELRCGISGPPLIPSFGLGIFKERFRIDVAAKWRREIGYVLDCGIGYTFKH